MACPNLEKHFDKLEKKLGGIGALHVDGRYSFMDRYSVDLRVSAIRDSILATLDEEVDDDLTMLRDFLYQPNSLNFIKAINLLQLMGDDKRKVALDYAKGYLSDFWSVEHDEYRILPRFYVEKILEGGKCPEWIWEVCKSIDISYLSPEDKVKFLNAVVNSSFLTERVQDITHFNIGLFDYSERNGWARGYVDVLRDEGVVQEVDESDNLNLNANSLMSLRVMLESMHSLTHLNLSGVVLPEGNSIVDLVGACPNNGILKSLDISYAVDSSLCIVSGFYRLELDSLEEFRARGDYSFEYDSSYCGFLEKLRVLDLAGVTINNGGMFLDEVSCFRKLEELDLSDCAFGLLANFGLRSDSLKKLDISRLRCGYNGYHLELPELEDLRAKESGFWIYPGLGTVNVPRLKHLAFSGISGSEPITPVPCLNAGFMIVLPNLVSVDFDGCNFPPDVMRKYLVMLDDGLKYLNLPELDEAGITEFSELVSGLELEAFGYGGDPNLLFDGEGRFFIPKDGLRELDLRGTMDQREYIVFDQSFTDSLAYLGVNYDSLESVDLNLDAKQLNVKPLNALKVLVSRTFCPKFDTDSSLVYMHMTRDNFPPSDFDTLLEGSSLLGLRVDADLVPQRLMNFISSIAPHLQYGNVGVAGEHRRIYR